MMFDLNTVIHIVGHVLVVVYVEDFPDWWHSTYDTSLIMPVFMRFQLSWFDSSVCQISSTIMEILIHCISSASMEILILCISSSWRFWSIIYCTWQWPHIHILYIMPIHGHCTCMYRRLLYAFAVICRDWLLYYTDGWMVLPPGSSSLHFWDGFIIYFGHHVTLWPHTLGGICYSWFYHTW